MCKDIIINFIRNGKMVPRELYQLVETDQNALREQSPSESSQHRSNVNEERLDTESVGVQCDPLPPIEQTQNTHGTDPYVAFDLNQLRDTSGEHEIPKLRNVNNDF